jgi:predicted amidohydrolase YtcJ
VGPAAVRTAADLAATLRRADAALAPGAWLRAVGYHESVAGDLDGAWLDAVLPHRPVRVQHRSGACWIVNGAAAAIIGLAEAVEPGVERAPDGRATGRVFGADDWLGDRVPRVPADVGGVARRLASFGITAVTDATPTERVDELAVLAAASAAPGFAVQVTVTGGPALPPQASPELPRGPVKLVMTDHDLPGWDQVMAGFLAARRLDRPVAVHCVTLAGLVLALAAWEEVGARPGDRIEHGAVVPVELIPRLRDLGLTVVTQPHFTRERGDTYLDDVEPDEREDLWRCASLRAGGVAIAGSSDAPFGSDDPWAAMAAAVDRRTSSGRVLGAREALTAATALGMYLSPLDDPGGPPRSIAVGAAADCCVLDRPLSEALAALEASSVIATLAAGHITHRP